MTEATTKDRQRLFMKLIFINHGFISLVDRQTSYFYLAHRLCTSHLWLVTWLVRPSGQAETLKLSLSKVRLSSLSF